MSLHQALRPPLAAHDVQQQSLLALLLAMLLGLLLGLLPAPAAAWGGGGRLQLQPSHPDWTVDCCCLSAQKAPGQLHVRPHLQTQCVFLPPQTEGCQIQDFQRLLLLLRSPAGCCLRPAACCQWLWCWRGPVGTNPEG